MDKEGARANHARENGLNFHRIVPFEMVGAACVRKTETIWPSRTVFGNSHDRLDSVPRDWFRRILGACVLCPCTTSSVSSMRDSQGVTKWLFFLIGGSFSYLGLSTEINDENKSGYY